MVRLSEIYRQSKNTLEKSGVEAFDFDARCIIEDVFGTGFAQLMISDKCVSEENQKRISDMINKRSEGYPLQYILGEWEFYGLPFKVGDGVLIPRADTETLVEAVLEYCKSRENLKIADLCAGSGCIAVSLEKNTINSEVYAVELSDKAYKYLEENIILNNSAVESVKGDVLSADTAEKFHELDVIVSNPPYLTAEDMNNLQKEVSYEPEAALYGKTADGLEFYRTIPKIWKNSLKTGGFMAFEIGMGQEKDVIEILAENGFSDIRTYKDLAGIIRVVSGIKRQVAASHF